MFYDLTIAFYGGIMALIFYNVSNIIWTKILFKLIKKDNDSNSPSYQESERSEAERP